MAAKFNLFINKKSKNSGQSLLEFAFLVPIFVGLIQILIQVETAISMSIVSQKHARGAMQHLLFNHRNYFELNYIYKQSTGAYMNRYWILMDNIPHGGTAGGDVDPEAPTTKIGNYVAGDDSPQAEFGSGITTRQKVRVRNSVFICLPPTGAKGESLLSENNIGEDTFSAGRYPFCRD